MATEIFIEPELEELSQVEKSQEWLEICETINLKGQASLVKTGENEVRNEPPPYMYIDPKTQNIIRALCPRKAKVADYKASTIPLDVLREAKRCMENDWYPGGLYVFYDDKSPDPFLVGQLSPDSWGTEYHLIARWGNELLPMEELEIKAIARLRQSAQIAANRLSAEVRMILDDVDGFVARMLNGESKPAFDFEINNLRW